VFVALDLRFRTPSYRIFRTRLFFALGGSAFLPVLHVMSIYGVALTYDVIALKWMMITALLYVFGAVVYGTRMPESLFPGSFDIWGSSHQIFHSFVLAATLTNYYGVMQTMSFWHEKNHECQLDIGFKYATQTGVEFMYKYFVSTIVFGVILILTIDCGPDLVMWIFSGMRNDFFARLKGVKREVDELESYLLKRARQEKNCAKELDQRMVTYEEVYIDQANISQNPSYIGDEDSNRSQEPTDTSNIFVGDLHEYQDYSNTSFASPSKKGDTFFSMSYKVGKGLRTSPFAMSLPAVENPHFEATCTQLSLVNKGEWPSPPRKEPCRYISNTNGAHLKLRLGHPEELCVRKT
ncbi:7874_t:CDS:2, partial [Acaulospora morrowiae]